ncbi:hypothetical protein D0C36_22430 [Mucilaginibacter conchicola]|uniref:Uncharacterized protein n=1 Tax=Mucilaginibacter conchicola TaxID=2303333 RepID=A0A372NNM0_9SPHI|nr:hypothetical protein [Mucilaginibacter conchicola]RFZ90539.1 hypothetical protein D0C36_22430 [Mucilaginibacter conchicola]
MNRYIEKLKKQLTELAEVVNSFQSEAVQVKVVERLLDEMIEAEKGEAEGSEVFNKRGRRAAGGEHDDDANNRKKPGATKVLNQLLTSDYFRTPHSISAIAEYCREKFNSDFKTSELSGILLKLSKENKLRRERNNDSNRFEYVGA